MVAKLTRLTNKIAIQLHLVAESCTIFSSRSRWPVQKLLDTPSYLLKQHILVPALNGSQGRANENYLRVNIYGKEAQITVDKLQ
jgi:hypothetical protein